MNEVIMTGRLAADIEEKTINDKLLSKFTLACNDTEPTLFVPVEAWQMAHLSKYLQKGSKVILRGRLKLTKWQPEGKDKQTYASIVARAIEFLDPLPKKG